MADPTLEEQIAALDMEIEAAENRRSPARNAALRAALASLERMRWRPISDYDGYDIVIFADAGGHVWPGHRHTTNAEGPEFVWFNGFPCTPIRFMPLPLPAPPSGAGDA